MGKNSPPPPKRDQKHNSSDEETNHKEKERKSQKPDKLPFAKRYEIKLPSFITKGLLEKAGCKEHPNDMVLELVLRPR